MKIDALRIVVETPVFASEKTGIERERYASANTVSSHGRFGGRKSPEYLALFRAVREAARAEMEAVGWTTWPMFCEVQVVRYHRTLVGGDASNLGKVEIDALAPSTPKQERRDRCAPFSGVYENDRLANPHHTAIEHDPEGPDRIVILVRRRYTGATVQNTAPRTRKPAQERAERVTPTIAPQPSAPRPTATNAREPMATLNGKPIPVADALRMILGDDPASGRHSHTPTRRRR